MQAQNESSIMANQDADAGNQPTPGVIDLQTMGAGNAPPQSLDIEGLECDVVKHKDAMDTSNDHVVAGQEVEVVGGQGISGMTPTDGRQVVPPKNTVVQTGTILHENHHGAGHSTQQHHDGDAIMTQAPIDTKADTKGITNPPMPSNDQGPPHPTPSPIAAAGQSPTAGPSTTNHSNVHPPPVQNHPPGHPNLSPGGYHSQSAMDDDDSEPPDIDTLDPNTLGRNWWVTKHFKNNRTCV